MPEEERCHSFASAARKFCEFVESAATFTLHDRLHVVRELLAALLCEGSRLPAGDPGSAEIMDDVAPPEGWPGFGEFDPYWELFDPYTDDDPVAGSLSDDVLDTYCDVRRGLIALERGEVDEAIWEWKFHFDHHWGDHAADALRAVHRACQRIARQP